MHVSVQTIGAPTAIIEIGTLRFITDPTFDPPGRYRADTAPEALMKTAGPAIDATDIRRIDAALLSHDQHIDNLDISGRQLLATLPITLTTPTAAARLDPGAKGLEHYATCTVQRAETPAVVVTALPARHGPGGSDPITGPVNGFLLSSANAPTIYISGDNASVEVIREIATRVGQVDIAILFVGAARLPWLFDGAELTLDNAAALQATHVLDPKIVIPLHHDSWSHLTQPVDGLIALFDHAGMADRLRVIPPGTTAIIEPATT
ncbi:MAG: MBL fold metallo-hydrolase [Solirubrobacteraceae bacterium]